jgi:hypothetical protein
MNETEKESFRIVPPKMDLSSLAIKVCNVYGVTLDKLRSGRRRHEVVGARGVPVLKAIKKPLPLPVAALCFVPVDQKLTCGIFVRP